MKVKNLGLNNFRNYENLRLDFKDQNIIFGPNASGKSSILEALNLLATGRSVRANFDKEMIKKGVNLARVEADIVKNGDEINLEMTLIPSNLYENLSRKQVKINGVGRSISNFTGVFNTVIFTPQDLLLITHGPSVRRKYLDSIFSQISKDYRRSLKNLAEVIKRRNKVLEKINKEKKGQDEIGLWDEMLLTESKVIHDFRKSYFYGIKKILVEYGNKLNDSPITLELNYLPNEVSTQKLEKYKEREIAAKTTLVGPGRDDFRVIWDRNDLESFGSRGQQRTSVLALKLCEIDFISKAINERPVLLLDDIFSELDENHRAHVFGILNLQQSIITTTDLKPLNRFADKFNIIEATL
ncbi:DNA replication and repair protein RecF [candidate division WWE3 bacterium]|nr:DNA replication and repair protein RecF [candidate division WWE3 bacterium]